MSRGSPVLSFRCPAPLEEALSAYCVSTTTTKVQAVLDFLQRGLAGELPPPLPAPESVESKLSRLEEKLDRLAQRTELGFQELDAAILALDHWPSLDGADDSSPPSVSVPVAIPESKPEQDEPSAAKEASQETPPCCYVAPFPLELSAHAVPSDGPALNAGQREAVQILSEWWKGDERAATLSGAAGTGKTFAVGHFLKAIGSPNVAFLAPTHKAKKVLRQALLDAGVNVEVSTIAKALGRQPELDASGEQTFKRKGDTLDIASKELLIVDEASMIAGTGEDPDYRGLRELKPRLLFLGDKCQLPPVREEISPVWADPEIQTRTELKEVMRYRGHLGDVAGALREAVLAAEYRPELVCPGEGVVFLPRRQWFALAKEKMAAEAFDRNPDLARFLAYRNSQVLKANETCREAIHPDKGQYFALQKLVANSPIMRQTYDPKTSKYDWVTICNNSDEIQALEDPKFHKLQELWQHVPAYVRRLADNLLQTECQSFLAETLDEGTRFRAIVLGVEAEACRQDLITKLQAEAKVGRLNKDGKGCLKFLYNCADQLRDLYALTVHKSQGSGFGEVFLDLPDISAARWNPKKGESDPRPRLLYTAFTRAKSGVYVPLS